MQLCSEYQSELLDSNQLIAYSPTINNLIESQYRSIRSGQSSLMMYYLSLKFGLQSHFREYDSRVVMLDFELRQVLFWVNGTDHVFNFRNNKSSNQTDTNSSLEYEDTTSSQSESVSIVTEIPDWKQSFENTMDIVFNRQKRFSNDTEISDDQDIGDFDDFGE